MNPEHEQAGTAKKPQTSHHEIAGALRERIRSGALPPGHHIPTQASLAGEFGAERATVRRALQILQSEGLLTHVTKGSPPVVADTATRVPGPELPPQSTTVALAPRITAAFAADHVRIDALCLTAVSLTLAIGEPLRQIHAGLRKPAGVDVRVLLPSRRISLAFPAPVREAPDDDRLHQRWLTQRNAQGQVLRHNLRALRATHGIETRVTFRALPFTPPVKLYLLNGDEALLAFYTLAKRDEEIDHEHLEMYAAQGTRSTLFPFERGASLRDTAFVDESRLWFDALWTTISSDLELTV